MQPDHTPVQTEKRRGGQPAGYGQQAQNSYQYQSGYQPGYPPQNGEMNTHRRPKHRGRFMRFIRGYLMLVGALSTLYVLVQLLVRLFIEVGRWAPVIPIS